MDSDSSNEETANNCNKFIRCLYKVYLCRMNGTDIPFCVLKKGTLNKVRLI